MFLERMLSGRQVRVASGVTDRISLGKTECMVRYCQMARTPLPLNVYGNRVDFP